MAPFRLVVALALIFLIPCPAQQVVPKYSRAPQLIRDVLREANVSGSLIFSGGCKFEDRPGPVPYVGGRQELGDVRETLQHMLALNSKIRVTQDPDGMIRMMEADVPTDILEVKIHHVSFVAGVQSNPSFPFHGPFAALMAILTAPEVRAFMKNHSIASESRLEGALPTMPDVSGELNDVTVSQALDYVLKTFPGYWVYKNGSCEDGSRMVRFRFY